MSKKEEIKIQKAICQYMDVKHPGVIYRSDGAGLKLPIGQATHFSVLQSGKSYPDMFFAEARGGYFGLFIEIKAKKSDVYTKYGDLRKSAHIRSQDKMRNRLLERGYYAAFGVGIDSCISIIDNYLQGDET